MVYSHVVILIVESFILEFVVIDWAFSRRSSLSFFSFFFSRLPFFRLCSFLSFYSLLFRFLFSFLLFSFLAFTFTLAMFAKAFCRRMSPWISPQLYTQFLGSIVVSIPACHAGDRGSIPRRGERVIFAFSPARFHRSPWSYIVGRRPWFILILSFW